MSPWLTAVALIVPLHVAAIAATDPANGKPAAAKSSPAPSAQPAKAAESTKADLSKADQNRRKPLQRCDELKDKAQLECLKKARERIVEARAKREAKGGGR